MYIIIGHDVVCNVYLRIDKGIMQRVHALYYYYDQP